MNVKKGKKRFAYLNQLSTSELEDIIRADLVSRDNENIEMIFCALEELSEREKKEPGGEVFDKERLWQDIQMIYCTPEGKGRVLYPEYGEDSKDP